jgi:hypothetical protein
VFYLLYGIIYKMANKNHNKNKNIINIKINTEKKTKAKRRARKPRKEAPRGGVSSYGYGGGTVPPIIINPSPSQIFQTPNEQPVRESYKIPDLQEEIKNQLRQYVKQDPITPFQYEPVYVEPMYKYDYAVKKTEPVENKHELFERKYEAFDNKNEPIENKRKPSFDDTFMKTPPIKGESLMYSTVKSNLKPINHDRMNDNMINPSFHNLEEKDDFEEKDDIIDNKPVQDEKEKKKVGRPLGVRDKEKRKPRSMTTPMTIFPSRTRSGEVIPVNNNNINNDIFNSPAPQYDGVVKPDNTIMGFFSKIQSSNTKSLLKTKKK